MNRRTFIRGTTLAAASLALAPSLIRAEAAGFPVVRTPEAKRKFKSAAVESKIAQVQSSIGNQELAWMFGNCFPNTLDTTVDFEVADGRPDTYVITGDIDAMWLRDSSAQVWPYLPLMKEDPNVATVDRRRHQPADALHSAGSLCQRFLQGPRQSQRVEKRLDRHETRRARAQMGGGFALLPHPPGPRLLEDHRRHRAVRRAWREAHCQNRSDRFASSSARTGRGPYHFQRRTETPTDTLCRTVTAIPPSRWA